jgi:crotonobetainyl-CoA:carnitine CoA-transferase CaiB-like acyl-CoA transferase
MADALTGLRVIDMATVIAGPSTAKYLADFGADVIKVERTDGGDTARSMGWQRDGVSLWWKNLGRNKRTVAIDLKAPAGCAVFRRLVATADVLVENFRPGTLERLGLAPADLLTAHPGLVVLRISGFGQDGPYRDRAGFGTLAESMSGFTFINGHAEMPPALPPVAIADEVTGLFGAMAVLVALRHRDGTGEGQVIDLSLIESLFAVLGPLPSVYDQLGEVAQRMGSRIGYSAPRGCYPTKDGKWLALSGTAQSVAERILAAIGRDDLLDDPRYATNNARVEHVEQLDEIITEWTSARTLDECMDAMLAADAAAAPVFAMDQLFDDPHIAARGAIATVDDPDLGPLRMQNVAPRLSRTPGRVAHAGKSLGADTDAVLDELGYPPEERAALRRSGAIA